MKGWQSCGAYRSRRRRRVTFHNFQGTCTTYSRPRIDTLKCKPTHENEESRHLFSWLALYLIIVQWFIEIVCKINLLLRSSSSESEPELAMFNPYAFVDIIFDTQKLIKIHLMFTLFSIAKVFLTMGSLDNQPTTIIFFCFES